MEPQKDGWVDEEDIGPLDTRATLRTVCPGCPVGKAQDKETQGLRAAEGRTEWL